MYEVVTENSAVRELKVFDGNIGVVLRRSHCIHIQISSIRMRFKNDIHCFCFVSHLGPLCLIESHIKILIHFVFIFEVLGRKIVHVSP